MHSMRLVGGWRLAVGWLMGGGDACWWCGVVGGDGGWWRQVVVMVRVAWVDGGYAVRVSTIVHNIAAAGAVDRELLYIGRARAGARAGACAGARAGAHVRARARDFASRAGSGAAGDRKVNGF